MLETLSPRAASNLPAPSTTFVGREQEIAAVTGLLRRDEVRLLTLTGPGGIGKTRLAIAVANGLAADYPDGVVFVPLAAVSDPARVLSAIAVALDIDQGDGLRLVERIVGAVRTCRMLLVLDNLERLLPAAISLAEVLAACRNLTILTTSRVALHLSAEQVFPVPSLAESEAVDLFVQRARALLPDFARTVANAPVLAEICRRLDGLPLAIELAAARVKVLPPPALLARLDNRLHLLTSGPQDLPDRLQTMHRAIAWSYDLLTPTEQHFFRQLGVFTGGFTLDAAETVGRWDGGTVGNEETGRRVDGQTGSDAEASPAVPPSRRPAVLELVSSLVDKSLLRSVPQQDGEPRFQMLETIREFALEQLVQSGEAETAQRRHAAWCLALAEEGTAQLWGPAQLAWMERFKSERANMSAALDWLAESGDAEATLQLAGALGRFWYMHADALKGRGWLERALTANPAAPSSFRIRALAWAGMLAWSQGDFLRATALHEENLALARATDSRRDIAIALFGLGEVAQAGGDDTDAEAKFGEALAIFRTLDERSWLGQTLNGLAQVARRRGDFAGATALIDEALALFRSTGDPWAISEALLYCGRVARDRGENPLAANLFRESGTLYWEHGDRRSAAACLGELAIILASFGQLETATRLFGTVAAVRETLGVPQMPAENEPYERALSQARAGLGEETFAAAWAAGRSTPLEQAISATGTIDLTRHIQAPNARQAGQADLTPRELEVLRLLAEGHSDPAIAAALFVSRRTAATHVANILSKLGLPSRAAAAAYAVRHNLA